MGLIFIFLRIVAIGCAALSINREEPVAYWDFSKQNSWTVYETSSQKPYKVSTYRIHPEFVKGISGDALRLDGYSTFVQGHLARKLTMEFTISGWFALESLPTDTSGFFSLSDGAGKNSITAAADRFGRPMIGLKRNGSRQYSTGSGMVPKFEWVMISLSVSQDRVTLWLNEEAVCHTEYKLAGSSLEKVILGRDERSKLIHNIFPVTAINGLMDEISIQNGALGRAEIRELYLKHDPTQKPDLRIPSVRFKDDHSRPGYHLLPAANWTNETHGLIFYKGRYHIFNQKNAAGVYLGQINWGHFSSPDLINWTEHKPALAPEHEYEKNGIWSGHVVLDDSGVPLIMYTGGDGKQNSLSIAEPEDDGLINWRKPDSNPVVKRPPGGPFRGDMRDPFMWKDGQTWYMIVGSGVKEDNIEKGAVLLYKSPDLRNWSYVKPLFTGDPQHDNSGVFWEMPVFWKLGGKYILLVNKVPQPDRPAVAFYWVGDFVNESFVPDKKAPRNLEVVNRLLSPSLAVDSQGRSVAIAIIPDETSAHAEMKQGWAHLYSLPRVWNLKDGKILQTPLPELAKLRGNATALQERGISGTIPLSRGERHIELELTVRPPKSGRFGFNLGKSPDGSEYTRIIFDYAKQQVSVDLRKSTLCDSVKGDLRVTDFKLDPDHDLNIRLFVDGSVAEVFFGEGEAFTTRMFPRSASANLIEFFSEGGETRISSGTMWRLQPSEIKSDW